MVEEVKEAPAAEGGAEVKPAGTGTPAAKVDDAKPGDQKQNQPEAQAKETADAEAKAAADKVAAEAATKAEADRLAKEKEGKKEEPTGKEAEEAAKVKAEQEATEADKKMRATWEKLRKDGNIGLNDDQMLAIENYARENKLDNAAKSVVIHQQNQILSQQKKDWEETQKRWVGELQASQEFGGKAFAASMEGARRVAVKYIDPEDLKQLDDTGLGNAPILLKAFARIHRDLVASDSFVPVGDDPGAKPKPRSAEDALFPNSDPNQAAIE